jgi:proline iminopeptidase
MVNGGPGLTHQYLDPLAVLLASASHRVVTYEQRGMGMSTKPTTTGYALDAYVSDLEAIRAFLGAQRIHLLGHSFGGLVVEAYLAAHTDRVGSVILADAEPPDSTDLNAAFQRANAHITTLQQQGLIPNPLPTECQERNAAVTPAYFYDPKFPVPDEIKTTDCNGTVQSVTQAGIDKGFDLRTALATVSVPVLLIIGEGDLFGVQMQTDTAAGLPKAKVTSVVVPKCGHFGWFEAPSGFEGPLQAFVDTNVVP